MPGVRKGWVLLGPLGHRRTADQRTDFGMRRIETAGPQQAREMPATRYSAQRQATALAVSYSRATLARASRCAESFTGDIGACAAGCRTWTDPVPNMPDCPSAPLRHQECDARRCFVASPQSLLTQGDTMRTAIGRVRPNRTQPVLRSFARDGSVFVPLPAFPSSGVRS